MTLYNEALALINSKIAYIYGEITLSSISWVNYFWALILFSAVVALGEYVVPWRRSQKILRKDFWLDTWYMFFNFFIFTTFFMSWIGLLTFASTTRITGSEPSSWQVISLSALPLALQLFIFFIILDFVQWGVHRILHKVPLFWQFHKVHHSVEEMSFPAHLRYHWMENILYTPVKYLAVTLFFGTPPEMAFITYYSSILIGHLNHANIKITYGPLKYILNNSVMHLWHHAKHLPKEKQKGVNFGISLSLWDYLFGTAYIPKIDADIELGFKDITHFPHGFIGQGLYPFKK